MNVPSGTGFPASPSGDPQEGAAELNGGKARRGRAPIPAVAKATRA